MIEYKINDAQLSSVWSLVQLKDGIILKHLVSVAITMPFLGLWQCELVRGEKPHITRIVR